MTDVDVRRVVRVRIGARALMLLFRSQWINRVDFGLPEGFVVQAGPMPNMYGMSFDILVHHPSFDVVPEGIDPPLWRDGMYTVETAAAFMRDVASNPVVSDGVAPHQVVGEWGSHPQHMKAVGEFHTMRRVSPDPQGRDLQKVVKLDLEKAEAAGKRVAELVEQEVLRRHTPYTAGEFSDKEPGGWLPPKNVQVVADVECDSDGTISIKTEDAPLPGVSGSDKLQLGEKHPVYLDEASNPGGISQAEHRDFWYSGRKLEASALGIDPAEGSSDKLHGKKLLGGKTVELESADGGKTWVVTKVGDEELRTQVPRTLFIADEYVAAEKVESGQAVEVREDGKIVPAKEESWRDRPPLL